MNSSRASLFLICIFVCHLNFLVARQPYHATIRAGIQSASVSAPNLVDLRRDLANAIDSAFTPILPLPPASLDINLRGIDVNGSFALNSTTLVVTIPQTGTTQTFSGSTRSESLTLLKDYIRDGGTHHNLLRAYAKYSPIDPIAGNPNSLMAQMAQSDYLLGRLSPLSGCDCGWNAQPIVHQFQLGINGCRAFSGGFETTSVTLPTRYSYSPQKTWAFILDAPITYNRNGGASSLFSSVGIGAQLPITSNWSLTSIARIGVGGSLDLCTCGSFLSAGLTSVYNCKIPHKCVLSMINYAGYTSSLNLWLSGINFTYHLHTYIFKNGLSLTTCNALTLCQKLINFSLSFEDSYFAKSHLFIKHYDEIACSLIVNYINPYLDYDCLTIGFSYQFGQKHYKGYCLNSTYQF